MIESSDLKEAVDNIVDFDFLCLWHLLLTIQRALVIKNTVKFRCLIKIIFKKKSSFTKKPFMTQRILSWEKHNHIKKNTNA